jgi:hypothetical protein
VLALLGAHHILHISRIRIKCNGHLNLFAFKKCPVPLGRSETVILVQWNSKSVTTLTLIFIIQD